MVSSSHTTDPRLFDYVLPLPPHKAASELHAVDIHVIPPAGSWVRLCRPNCRLLRTARPLWFSAWLHSWQYAASGHRQGICPSPILIKRVRSWHFWWSNSQASRCSGADATMHATVDITLGSGDTWCSSCRYWVLAAAVQDVQLSQSWGRWHLGKHPWANAALQRL